MALMLSASMAAGEARYKHTPVGCHPTRRSGPMVLMLSTSMAAGEACYSHVLVTHSCEARADGVECYGLIW
jgi:hypothetical protein